MSDLFNDKYKDSLEAKAFEKIQFNKTGPKIPKWTNVQTNEKWSIFERDARILLLILIKGSLNMI